MANDKTHRIYSDKLTLHVLELNKEAYATEENKSYGIDYWAKLFKSTTWEEALALSETNETIMNLTKTMYAVTQDERVRFMCERHLESEKTHIVYEKYFKG